jgi:cell division protein FtsW (lipid II flippase)
MQPPMMPPMAPRQPPMNMLLALSFIVGLGLLMLAGILVSSTTMANVNANDAQNWNAYAAMSWNAGFFFLLVAIFGTAAMRKDVDPLGRLFLWLVAFILVLVLFVAPGLFFSRP